MIQADIASISPADLRTYKLGSILAGGNAAPGDNVRTTPQAWLDLTDEFFRASLPAVPTAHRAIPILFGIDAVHGHAKVVGATIFPHNVGLGAAHDPELMRRIGQATAEEVAATGIDWTFAPTVAVARDVRWGRSYESYSESPDLVAAVRRRDGRRDCKGDAARRNSWRRGHTLSSVKHFLGDGGTVGRPRSGRRRRCRKRSCAQVHAAGYPAAIKAGALIVMASYNSWNGVKMHANHYLLTDILKGRLGFDGFVVGRLECARTNSGLHQVSTAPAAILAGVDMLMAPDSWRELYKNTLAEARSGRDSAARIDDAVRRILRVKAHRRLVRARRRPSNAPTRAISTRLGSAAHRALAREAVRKSLVLLKNDHGTAAA